MNTVEFIGNKGRKEVSFSKSYADSWDTITADDAPVIGELLYLLERNDIDVDQFRKLAVDRFLNRRNDRYFKQEGEAATQLLCNEYLLADTVNFFFKITLAKDEEGIEHEQYEVIPNFVTNLLPKIRVKGRSYYGPNDFLGEMSFLEFKDLVASSGKFMETKETEWLDRMLAISYRPRRNFLWFRKQQNSFSGLTRPKYNPGLVDSRAKLFSDLPIGVKYIFFMYFMGCMYMLKTDADGAGIDIDGHTCSLSLVFNPKRSKYDDDFNDDDSIGLVGVIMALAETGVFGDIKQTGDADVWDVIARLYQLELNRRDLERNSRKR